MNHPVYQRRFPLKKAEAKKLRICWQCGESTAKRRRSAYFCSDACKQSHYRDMKKVDAAIAELQRGSTSVTFPAAIAAGNVTDFTVDRTSGKESAN